MIFYLALRSPPALERYEDALPFFNLTGIVGTKHTLRQDARGAAKFLYVKLLLRFTSAQVSGNGKPNLWCRPVSPTAYFNRYTEDALDLCDVLGSYVPGAKAEAKRC
jgi:hypothetical protein